MGAKPQRLVAQQYEAGQALNMAATLEIDAVIDPAQTRDWLVRGQAAGRGGPLDGVGSVDAW